MASATWARRDSVAAYAGAESSTLACSSLFGSRAERPHPLLAMLHVLTGGCRLPRVLRARQLKALPSQAVPGPLSVAGNRLTLRNFDRSRSVCLSGASRRFEPILPPGSVRGDRATSDCSVPGALGCGLGVPPSRRHLV